MGTITGQQVTTRVQRTLLDETGVAWTAPELLVFLAASFPAIVVMKPNANATNRRFLTQKGTLQNLGEEDVALIKVVRNVGADGITPGRGITYAGNGDDFTRSTPNWHTDPPSKVVINYIFDQADPKHWYCYPPMDFPPSYVDIVTGALPPRYTDDTLATPIPLPDEYEDAIVFYMLANAYAKNAKRGDMAKANFYMNQCRQFLGLEAQAETKFTPGTPEKGEAP